MEARIPYESLWDADEAFTVGTAVVAVLSWIFFLHPSSDRPTRVDAIVALGGDPGQLRAKLAIHLAEAGYASTVLVSLGGSTPAPCPSVPRRIEEICFRADPLNTRGEAEFGARTAARHHWTRLMVVPSTTQLTRARLLFARCTDATLVMVPTSDPSSQLAYDVLYEWGATAKALLLVRSC